MKKLFYLLSLVILLIVGSCKAPTVIDNVHAGSDFGVSCLSTDMDGTVTLRAWGKGKNKSQAMETAKKNAVSAVLFDGITKGAKGAVQRPVVTVVNARERYEDYFNRFFADGGDYREFTSMVDEKNTSRVKSANNSIENWGIVVRVDRPALVRRMKQDRIIEK